MPPAGPGLGGWLCSIKLFRRSLATLVGTDDTLRPGRPDTRERLRDGGHRRPLRSARDGRHRIRDRAPGTGADRFWYGGVSGFTSVAANVNGWYEFLEFYVAQRVPHLPDFTRLVAPAIVESQFGVARVQIAADRFTNLPTSEAAPRPRTTPGPPRHPARRGLARPLATVRRGQA